MPHPQLLYKPQGDLSTFITIVRKASNMEPASAAKDVCRQKVMDVFPDICTDYIDEVADQNDWDIQRIIDNILDRVENGLPYAKRASNSLKRKATDTELAGHKTRRKLANTRSPRMRECQCCCTEAPLSQMVHCNRRKSHWFCKPCARQTAETQIGLSKYQLVCMSMDGCEAGFSPAQRKKFLDEKLLLALDRFEFEANLRMAGIENLETCPFCPYAAEYPPAEANREFRCERRDCQKVSCRLCKRETHTPMTCEEAARERGYSVRRQIEEAMSKALIRKCNKCNTQFIKEAGCNKMTCPNTGCRNVQCYICSQSCDYSHFDEPYRGGKQGNCSLFDEIDIATRHRNEVQNAEEAARRLVTEKHPDVKVELLEIKMSDKVR